MLIKEKRLYRCFHINRYYSRFPGETEEDFEQTLDLVKAVGYDSHLPFYSVRKVQLPNEEIDYNIKHKRFQKLLDILYPIFYENNLKYDNRIVEILVEEVSKNNDKVLTGRTRTGKLVHFEGNQNLIGKLINVKITKIKSFTLEGYMV